MHMITQPMLATKCKNKDKIKYPVLATPKLDGIRCLILDGRAVARSLKPIPNPYIRHTLESTFPSGCDGELIIPGAKFNETTSVIMQSKDDTPVDFLYWVFDFVQDGELGRPYCRRMEDLRGLTLVPHMIKVMPCTISNREELNIFEEECLDDGYEGAMIRDPEGPYKCGRSTEREGWLLKIKRFEDGEAIIIGFEEKLHNANEAKTDLLGHTERSSHKENLHPCGTLGAITVQDLKHPEWIFNIGSGFDDALRAEIWAKRPTYLGRIVKYKYQPYGTKDLPRFPTFLGFRDEKDM